MGELGATQWTKMNVGSIVVFLHVKAKGPTEVIVPPSLPMMVLRGMVGQRLHCENHIQRLRYKNHIQRLRYKNYIQRMRYENHIQRSRYKNYIQRLRYKNNILCVLIEF